MSDNIPTVVRIIGFKPFRYEITGDSPFKLPFRVNFPPMQFMAIDLGWAVDGAYLGGEAELFGFVVEGEGEMSIEKLSGFLYASKDDLKEMFDVCQRELLKIELLK